MSILDQIVARRREDIARDGFTLGADVPERRTRAAPVPFIAQKGVVLEVKRASPSKGDIAPGLDAPKTARNYAEAGARAISVLTERNYFKGSLDDLRAVCAAMDDHAAAHPSEPPVAVLRKDFLIAPEEVDVAWRAGADAVLLICRILDDAELVAMARECAGLGMTAFIELRLDSDLDKLAKVAAAVPAGNIVCGVNARDLRDFRIDLLSPAGMLAGIRSVMGNGARVIFESGIRTPEAARFAGSLDFTGMLLGEAAARNPQEAAALVQGFTGASQDANARAWLSFAEDVRRKRTPPQDACPHSPTRPPRPLVKICGLTSKEDALYATLGGADFLGFIFCARSPRNVNPAVITDVRAVLDEQFTRTCRDEHIFAAGETDAAPRLVGVVTDCTSPEAQAAIALVREGRLDFLQLHGSQATEEFLARPELHGLAHYCVVNLRTEDDLAALEALRHRGEPRILVDSQAGLALGGTGTQVAADLVQAVRRKLPLWLAGGITPQNVADVVAAVQPELIDVCSGVERSPGHKDTDALLALFAALEGGAR